MMRAEQGTRTRPGDAIRSAATTHTEARELACALAAAQSTPSPQPVGLIADVDRLLLHFRKLSPQARAHVIQGAELLLASNSALGQREVLP